MASFRDRLARRAISFMRETFNSLQMSAPTTSKHSTDNDLTSKLENGELIEVDNIDSLRQQENGCLKLSVLSTAMVALICLFCFVGRDYIKYLLLWMENADISLTVLIFAALFTVVSFPMAWGYVLLNVAAGYLYGVLYGSLLVTICAIIGVVTAHLVIRKFMSDYVTTRFINDSMRAIIKVVEGDRGFKVIMLARLTPIPFGLTNALFAISDIKTMPYLCASVLGLIPTQSLNAYIGSTLRSMEEVLSENSHTTTAYVVFTSQLLLTVGLMFYVARRAKSEFARTLEDQNSASITKDIESSNSGDCAEYVPSSRGQNEYSVAGVRGSWGDADINSNGVTNGSVYVKLGTETSSH